MTRTREEIVVHVDTVHLNLSPHAFYLWATQFYACKLSFRAPDEVFSPVPYFLLGRAIELVIKARHLTRVGQKAVKDYGHNLIAAYKALDPGEQVLSIEERLVLEQTSDVYRSKAFEYFRPFDALTAFRDFPDLELLEQVARKLLDGSVDLRLP